MKTPLVWDMENVPRSYTRQKKERDIEKRLTETVKKMGGISYKFVSPSHRSVPDRICIFPGGKTLFVECKAPGKHPTAGQAKELAKLEKAGCKVAVIDYLVKPEDIKILL